MWELGQQMQNFVCYCKRRCVHGCLFIKLLFLPIYAAEAGREFGSGGFVVSYTGPTETVPRTVFRTRAIYVIMWTGHG